MAYRTVRRRRTGRRLIRRKRTRRAGRLKKHVKRGRRKVVVKWRKGKASGYTVVAKPRRGKNRRTIVKKIRIKRR